MFGVLAYVCGAGGNWLTTFRDNVSVPSARVKQFFLEERIPHVLLLYKSIVCLCVSGMYPNC